MADFQDDKYGSARCSNWFSYLFMCGVSRILKKGYDHHLNEEDLDPLHPSDDSRPIIDNLQEMWNQELRTAVNTGRKPRLWKAVMNTFSLEFILKIVILKTLNSFYVIMIIVMLNLYLDALEAGPRAHPTYTLLCLVGICLSTLFKLFAYHHEYLMETVMGMRLKIAVSGIVYKHVLKSSRYNLYKQTEGYIMNLVSNDARLMEKLVYYGMSLVRFFWETIFAVLVIIFLIGWQALSCILLFALMGFPVYYLAKLFSKFRQKQFKLTDRRLTTMNEIISGIRALKMNAWEDNYRKKVMHIRSQEISKLRDALMIRLNTQAFINVAPCLATLISILALAHARVPLTATSLFTLASLLGILTNTVGIGLSDALYSIFDAYMALGRMQAFLLEPDGNISATQIHLFQQLRQPDIKLHKGNDQSTDLRESKGAYVEVTELWASWGTNGSLALRNVSLSATHDKLVMVTGSVGCGKTSLLMAILKEIPIKHGSVDVRGKIAFASETPWVFSDTFRENILFGNNYIKKKYDHVIALCDLVDDVKRLPKGDLSMIGQRGVSLSGGQRSRLSLARAVYSGADIFLLDDPLSAVDTQVGQHIFDKCICGELKSKLRILATHQAQHLPRADHVMILDKGRVATQGRYNDIKNSSALREIMCELKRSRTMTARSLEQGVVQIKGEVDETVGYQDLEEEEEDRALGVVTWGLYWQYFRAGLSAPAIVFVLAFWGLAEVARIAPYWWLSVMSRMTRDQKESGLTFGTYATLICFAFFFYFIRTNLFTVAISRSSLNLYDKMTVAVTKCPVLFFDTNPVGRIMNRFSKDTGGMDNLLPYGLCFVLVVFYQFIAMVVSMAVFNPWFVAGSIPILVVFCLLVRFYLRTARELQRLESIKSSPLFAHVSDTMVGIETVRTYHMANTFFDVYIGNQNEQTRAFKLVLTTSRWANMYTDMMASLFVVVIAVGSQFLNQEPGVTGLLLTFAIQGLTQVDFGVQMASEVECLMTSVERIITYTKLLSEPGYHRRTLPPEDWPYCGALSIQGVSLEYLEGGTRVLDGVSLEVLPKEKVGIVGRTGAGKSSLVAALFRIREPKGRIVVDGIDLGSLNIQDARRAMSVITQTPLVFSGSLRKNLDPFRCFSDQEIWTALNNVQMKKCVESLPGKLEYRLGESGSGFSVGERQLLCLARALLQNTKLIVLDEATANVDYRTDRLVQQVIRDMFADVTVLTIAHRVNTIMDYDKVVVMDAGHVVEYGEPQELARRSDGYFARLVQAHDNMKRS
ncbi:ATP-binding cassette sub-family C member 4 isoform X2 [Nematostella vectensis]|nr:ATP-binding cassette sub-family C member 4 isoform X2 [Nematostella vectensis]